MKRLLALACFLLTLAAATAAPLAVVPGSASVEVAVRATGDSFTAKLAKSEIALAGDPATGAIATADVRFNWADLKTGKDARDKEMLKWAGADKNPAGHFALSKLAAAADGALTATGTLELAGQSHELSFPVKVARTDADWTVSGETPLDHRLWGLPKIRKFAVLTVDPVVTVRFALRIAAPAP